MKKLLFIITLSFLFQGSILSQSCLPGFVVFTSQKEINNFQINNPNCNEIEGDVLINGDDIKNLDGLSGLTALWGDLEIWYNDSLNNINGLGNITSIGGNIFIGYNKSLLSLSGLNNLDTIHKDVRIQFNHLLTGFSGLDNVSSITGRVLIEGNYSLESLTGLDKLTSIGEGLKVKSNPTLTSCSALINLSGIGGSLDISGNYYLQSLNGLDNIDASSIDSLYIEFNSNLSTCEVKSVCDYLVSPNGTIEIQANNVGCNSEAEVMDSCNTIGIQENDLVSNFSIYPNPAINEIIISSKNGININEIKIYNRLGQMVLQETRQTGVFDVSELRNGMYFVELFGDGFVVRKKLLIK